MKRRLLTQLCNEWRSNVWMVIELVIVGVVIWAIFSTFATLGYMHKEPVGINFDNVYRGYIGSIPSSATTFKAYPDTLHNYSTDLNMLEAKLRENPYIESLGTGKNAIPYNYNYLGRTLSCEIGDSVESYSANWRIMSPDMIRTLQLVGLNGETTGQLANMVDEGKILISTADQLYFEATPEKWVGHQAINGNDSSQVYEIGAIINGIRRVDYEPVFGGVVVSSDFDNYLPSEMAFRIREGKDREFMESLKADMLEFGNVYVYDIRSVDNIKEEAHHNISIVFRDLTVCALFLLFAVFLGFLGAFWYRTQQRVPELALRKVNGATNADIFRRFLGEGFILLAVAAVPIAGISILLLLQLDSIDLSVTIPKSLFYAMIPVALLALAVIIAAGIAIPAKKAMHVNPASALKDQ